MSDDLKVSIIIPTYNRVDVISEAVESVISQTYSNWELLISDDGSSDGTKQICSKLFEKDDRIRYFKNEKNLGLPANRNTAIRRAKGDMILFSEDDMILEKDCVEILIDTYQDLIQNGNRVGAVCPALVTKHSETGNKRTMLNHARKSKDEELSRNPCIIDKRTGLIYRNFSTDFKEIIKVEDCHSCSLYPKEIFDKFKYEEKSYKGTYTGEESDLHFRLNKAGYNLYFQPLAVMNHKVKDQGGCRLHFYLWSYYFVRNHIIFVGRNFEYKSVYIIPYFIFYVALTSVNHYIRRE